MESGELKKIGTKTVIGFLLVSRHIFKKVIRRHFLIGFFWPQVGQSYLFGTFDVCLFVCFHPLDFFLCIENMFWVGKFFDEEAFFFYIGWLCVCETFFISFSFFKDFFPNLKNKSFQFWKESRHLTYVLNICKGQLISEHISLLFQKTRFLNNFWLVFWSTYVSGRICCGIIWPLENTSYLKVRVKVLSKLSSTITISNIFFIKPTPYLRILTQTIKVSNSYCL